MHAWSWRTHTALSYGPTQFMGSCPKPLSLIMDSSFCGPSSSLPMGLTCLPLHCPLGAWCTSTPSSCYHIGCHDLVFLYFSKKNQCVFRVWGIERGETTLIVVEQLYVSIHTEAIILINIFLKKHLLRERWIRSDSGRASTRLKRQWPFLSPRIFEQAT